MNQHVESFPMHGSAGELCGDQTAWARFEVVSSERAVVSIFHSPSSPGIEIRLIAPGGSEVLKLTPDRNCAVLDLEVGIWTIAAIPTSSQSDRRAPFAVSVTPARFWGLGS